jgi:hypothetical protein
MEATKMSVEESKQIAGTILQQLGGRKFIMMTGAKNFFCDGPSCGMKIMRNQSKANYLKITLNSLDLYDMEFFAIDRQFNHIHVQEFNGVYDDMLQSIFTKVTGLYTHL